MRKSKKATPSFEVARADLGESRVGWVYRSETPAPAVIESVAVASVRTESPSHESPSRESPSRESARRESPRRESPQAETPHSWVETGIGVMVLPLTLTVVAMMAPVLWLFAPRAHR
jgi:hypothetical protein